MRRSVKLGGSPRSLWLLVVGILGVPGLGVGEGLEACGIHFG